MSENATTRQALSARLTLAGGAVYEGQVAKGEPHGEGRMSWPDGTAYEGAWRAGLPQGTGVMTMVDGAVHVGQFRDGEAQGRGAGALTSPDGECYRGSFEDGQPHGRDTLWFPGDARLEGEWERGELVDGDPMMTPDGSPMNTRLH